MIHLTQTRKEDSLPRFSSGAGPSPGPGQAPDYNQYMAQAIQVQFGTLMAGTDVQAQLEPPQKALADITAHDPGFDETRFLSRAEWAYHLVQQAIQTGQPAMSRQVMADTMWLQHRDAILAAQRGGAAVPVPLNATAAIAAAHTDPSYDTIVVRFTPQGGGEAQDWSFQRSAGAVTVVGAGAMADKCPNCGAPLNLNESGACSYCQAAVTSGQYDWVLVRTQPVQNPYAQFTRLSDIQLGTVMPVMETVARTGRMIAWIVGAIIIVPILLGGAGVFAAFSPLAKPAISSGGATSTLSGPGTRYTNTLTLAGITPSPKTSSGTESTSPNCTALAKNSTGLTATFQLPEGAATIKVKHPSGPGSYDQTNSTVTIDLVAPGGETSKQSQSWASNGGSVVKINLGADGNDTVAFGNLPALKAGNAHATPLSGAYTETCANR
ncbi:MAG: hypothetical protein QOE92_829 [Chloroflexota bacterium]|jgi:hypothetical protein|nr:hypothetical protein [Chloroflexota bacterium]